MLQIARATGRCMYHNKYKNKKTILDRFILASVCVWDHLNRCKTSIRWFRCTTCFVGLFMIYFPISISRRGAGGTDETGTNKDTHQLPVISMGTLIDVPASIFMSNFCNGTWLTQEPPCRFQTIWFHFLVCTVFAIWLSCIRTGKTFEQGRRKFSFAQFLISNHPNRSCQA